MKITIKIKIKIVHPIIAKKSVQRPIKTFLWKKSDRDEIH
jgi:hypothetical protein